MKRLATIGSVLEGAPQPPLRRITWSASTTLPTAHGDFRTHIFRTGINEESPGEIKEHVALVFGDIRKKSMVPVRVHSECITSEVFGSLKCDCRDQLQASMATIAQLGAGAILYLRQEGRGIGLTNKIRAYELQAMGHDTLEANRILGLPDDARTYHVAVEMLDYFEVQSVRLMTNSPDKVSSLRRLGVEVVDRMPVIVDPNPHSLSYLETKRLRMDHALPVRSTSPLDHGAPAPPISTRTLHIIANKKS